MELINIARRQKCLNISNIMCYEQSKKYNISLCDKGKETRKGEELYIIEYQLP